MNEASSTTPRLSTGIAGLDTILGGGLFEHGMYMIEGPSGAGKTILSAQMCFHHARAGKKILYVTLIAESHGKLINNLRAFDFLDDSLIPDRLILTSGYQELKSAGLSGLLQLIAHAVAEHRPAILVIDGYRSIHTLTQEPGAVAEFVYELSTLITTTKCLCLLLSPRDVSEQWTEKTLMDGVIELDRHSVGMRSMRELEVHKMRASAQIEGRHVFTIGSAGITVFPRLEAAVVCTSAAEEDARVAFGIEGFDDMLSGGIVRNSVTCLLGPPGSGKTIMGLHFLNQGTMLNEPSLYFGFHESPPRLLSKAAKINMQLGAAYAAGTFEIIWQPVLEHRMDELTSALLDTVRRRNVRRIVIDGLKGFLQSAIRPERISMFFNALIGELRRMQVTTIYTEEIPLFAGEIAPSMFSVSALAENIVLVRHIQREATMRRTIAVIKQRESAHDLGVREFWIENRGIRVAPDSGSAQAFLTER